MSVVVDSKLVSVPEAARLLSMSTSWTWSAIYAGEIPSLTLGRSRRIRLADLEQFIADRVEKAAA